MNKFVKSLLVAGSVAALAACSSSNNDAAGNGANNNGQTFGGYSVEDLHNVTTPFTSVSTNSTSKVNTFKS